MWPDVLEVVKGLRRFTWTLLSHNAQVAALDGNRLTLSMVNAGARDSFARGGSDEIVREALIRVLGVDWKVDAIVDPSTDPGAGPTGAGGGASRPQTSPGQPTASGRAAAMDRVAAESAAREPQPGTDTGSRDGGAPASSYDEPSADDPDADDSAVSHQELLARELGAKVIGEYDNS
jgi:DNA polymerase-3 subunit gamma/tau